MAGRDQWENQGDKMEEMIRYRHNAMDVNSLQGFASIRGGCCKNRRDVYFVRLLGRTDSLEQEIQEMDRSLTAQMQSGMLYYCRASKLPRLSDRDDTEYYAGCYGQWSSAGQGGVATKVSGKDDRLARQLGAACSEVIRMFSSHAGSGRAAVTESMKRNFAVKLLFWFDYVFGEVRHWDEKSCVKVVAENIVKEQEYLFYYLLTLVGCDVLLIQDEEDITEEKYRALSREIRVGDFGRRPLIHKAPVWQEDRRKPVTRQRPSMPRRTEKSFEELALLASSVVMITVHDRNSEAIASGSGIMVGKSGYILTNDHVVRGGYTYSVRIENDDMAYQTDELIKYNPVLDLAVLRIGRQLDPIPVYQGTDKLARGQAVVAIGSPLGMFNSVSDGIISGFRTLDGVDMIQFTAPISHGSSGGAVLNMRGEVIGISTAGVGRGQNINLAVGYEDINLFTQGFR